MQAFDARIIHDAARILKEKGIKYKKILTNCDTVFDYFLDENNFEVAHFAPLFGLVILDKPRKWSEEFIGKYEELNITV